MAMFTDLVGTLLGYFKIGRSGVRLKDLGGHLGVRNTNDTADAEITASKVKVSGNDLELNSDAAGTGADRKFTVRRPASGMSVDHVLTLPADDGIPKTYVLQSDGTGGFSFVSANLNAPSNKWDTTSVNFNSASPVPMFTTDTNDVIESNTIIIDTPFNGAPTLAIGITGNNGKYMGSAEIDLTLPAGTKFVIQNSLGAQGSEALIATYSAGGASAGAARIITSYASPT